MKKLVKPAAIIALAAFAFTNGVDCARPERRDGESGEALTAPVKAGPLRKRKGESAAEFKARAAAEEEDILDFYVLDSEEAKCFKLIGKIGFDSVEALIDSICVEFNRLFTIAKKNAAEAKARAAESAEQELTLGAKYALEFIQKLKSLENLDDCRKRLALFVNLSSKTCNLLKLQYKEEIAYGDFLRNLLSYIYKIIKVDDSAFTKMQLTKEKLRTTKKEKLREKKMIMANVNDLLSDDSVIIELKRTNYLKEFLSNELPRLLYNFKQAAMSENEFSEQEYTREEFNSFYQLRIAKLFENVKKKTVGQPCWMKHLIYLYEGCCFFRYSYTLNTESAAQDDLLKAVEYLGRLLKRSR